MVEQLIIFVAIFVATQGLMLWAALAAISTIRNSRLRGRSFLKIILTLGVGGIGLSLLGTMVSVVIAIGSPFFESDPSEKATALAKGISDSMNYTAFGLLIAAVLGLCVRIIRRGVRSVASTGGS